MSGEGQKFGFYDAFCGIGAFHLAAVEHGGICVGACDKDRFARKTYEENFEPEGFKLDEDIHKLNRLPNNTHFLLAGFPCPTFSLAGKSKLLSLGRDHGLKDEERGQLIFRVIKLAKKSKPSVVILENVKHLLTHDGGRTIETILKRFRSAGYRLGADPTVLDAQDFGIPQHRKRVFIVLLREDLHLPTIQMPEGGKERIPLSSVLEDPEDVDPKYTLGEGTWETLNRHKQHHEKQGNGFGYRLWNLDDRSAVSATISARYHKDGAEALIPVEGQERPRRLMPNEVRRLMGFPDEFEFPVSDTQAYRQLGNSIVVPVAKAVLGAVVSALEEAGYLPFDFDSSRESEQLELEVVT